MPKHLLPVANEMLVLGNGNTMGNIIVRVVSGLPEGKTYPPPKDPTPPVEDSAAKAAAAWYSAWVALSESLDYDFWKAGDATLAPRMNKHLQAMKAEAPQRDTDVKLWFVMVKDSKGSFPGNDLWGDGWGWSWFDAGNPPYAPVNNVIN
jgi:hypothetical protein